VKEEEELMAEIGFENENVKTERTTQGISVEPNALAIQPRAFNSTHASLTCGRKS
jgi:hypothetical protein